MLRSLTSAVTGMLQSQQKMDVIGNNIANVNTTGYKAARVDFEDSFSQTLRVSNPGANGGGVTGIQVGTGVSTAAVKSLFQQGTFARTEVPTELAIDGPGFFMVRDVRTGEEFATRSGEFRLDSSGYLVTNSGHRVQGFSDSGLSTRGDLQIDGSGRPENASPTASLSSYFIDSEGKIHVELSDGTQYVRGQVLLQNFRDPQALVKEGGNLYSGIAAAGPLAQAETPGTNGLGTIQSAHLELSNVDLAGEFASLITTQRAFQANARIITTSDELIQEVVNLKR